MNPRFRYILIGLVSLIIYELYLIGFYKYQDLQISTHMRNVEANNIKSENSIEAKKTYLTYINTEAYMSRIAKSSLNKKLPGEKVINIVTEEDVASNEALNVNDRISKAEKQESSPMKGMSNREKWMYLLFKIRTTTDASDN